MKPVVYTEPHRYGQPDDVGLPRTDKAIKKILQELLEWGYENLAGRAVRNSFEAAINDVKKLQVTCWTVIDESMSRIACAKLDTDAALKMMSHWQDRGGRIGNVG